MIKKDCFAYKNSDCEALDKLYCKNEECKFYKTCEQNEKDIIKSNFHLTKYGVSKLLQTIEEKNRKIEELQGEKQY